MFDYIYLNTNETASTDLELRFLIASASFEKRELVAVAFSIEDETASKKFFQKTKRILSTLKREGKISFYVPYNDIEDGSTESEFLKNNYLPHLIKRAEKDTVIFVKV